MMGRGWEYEIKGYRKFSAVETEIVNTVKTDAYFHEFLKTVRDSLTVCDRIEIRAIQRDYRGVDRVLSPEEFDPSFVELAKMTHQEFALGMERLNALRDAERMWANG